MTVQNGSTEPQIIVTSDENYFEFLQDLEGNILDTTGRYPVVYDLGLTAEQRQILNSPIHKLDIPVDYLGPSSAGAIKSTHKPFCIMHAIKTYDRPCLYLDTDTMLVMPIDFSAFEGCDVAVTPRPKNEYKYDKLLENGSINAGVLWFANTKNAHSVLETWLELCSTTEESDQALLSDLLADADYLGGFGNVLVGDAVVKKLNPLRFNDTSCKIGDIWHFKNAGRKWRQFRHFKNSHESLRNDPDAFRSEILAERERFLTAKGLEF